MQPNIHIGTSGWSYAHWRNRFYPEWLPANEYLRFYSRHFTSTEINTTFYQQPHVRTVYKWKKSVPSSFIFCPKMYRGITHERKLLRPCSSLPPFFTSIAPLADQIGPILIQLPPSLDFQEEIAAQFFQVLRDRYDLYKYALEARHASWMQQKAIDLLKHYKIGFVIADSGSKWPSAGIITDEHIYLRFHGPDGSYGTRYTDDCLAALSSKIQAWEKKSHTVWAFFNNDGQGYAVENACFLQTATNGAEQQRKASVQLPLF